VQGLRELKKAATRQAISDVATRLFEERGFEQVTVAEIAAAAAVSVKTVFNYFGNKEELFFDRDDEMLEGMIRTLSEREPACPRRRRCARCCSTGRCRSRQLPLVGSPR